MFDLNGRHMMVLMRLILARSSRNDQFALVAIFFSDGVIIGFLFFFGIVGAEGLWRRWSSTGRRFGWRRQDDSIDAHLCHVISVDVHIACRCRRVVSGRRLVSTNPSAG